MSIKYAALSFDLTIGVDKAFRILPMGGFASNDGRPSPGMQWVLNDGAAARIVNYWQSVAELMVIDYEHQTQKSAENGKPAPAAGWVVHIESRADGIYIVPKWTIEASGYIDREEYKYISPVFSYDSKTGEILMLFMAGLTNTPGLSGLTELKPEMLKSFLTSQEENKVDKDLLKSLGLPENATQDQVNAAVTQLNTQLSTADASVATLTAEKASVGAELATLKAADKGVTAVAALQTQVVALQAELNGSKVKSLVDEGMADGRILPAMKDWAESLGRSDVAQLQAFLKNAPKIAALQSQQSAGMTHGSGTTDASGLTADELAVCHSTGVSPKDFAAAKKEFAD